MTSTFVDCISWVVHLLRGLRSPPRANIRNFTLRGEETGQTCRMCSEGLAPVHGSRPWNCCSAVWRRASRPPLPEGVHRHLFAQDLCLWAWVQCFPFQQREPVVLPSCHCGVFCGANAQPTVALRPILQSQSSFTRQL